MNWKIFWMIFILYQQHQQSIRSTSKYYYLKWPLFLIGQYNAIALANPIPQDPPPIKLNHYIHHWEPARYDRTVLQIAHRHHEATHRKKREINYNQMSSEYGSANTIKINFFAHDKQFNLVLHENPSSVFTEDVLIENTFGPIAYDISRIYTGTLEDDEHSVVHGILTKDNLFDGTISTNQHHYYIEPSAKYSKDLFSKNGVHSIVYKSTDVDMDFLRKSNSGEHCGSEKLRKKIKNEYKKRRKSMELNNLDNHKERYKRWLPEELSDTRNPPLPLDLDVPYNDDFTVYRSGGEHADSSSSTTDRTKSIAMDNVDKMYKNPKNTLINNYNPNSDFNLKLTNTNKNVLLNDYDVTSTSISNTKYNYSGSRPSHKTHVEIITRNGATKKPNHVSNYDPEIILTNNNFHHTHISLNNIHNSNNDIGGSNGGSSKTSYDRKITCMLYLQADHTFYSKMGSDDASIEAITRHVQRANAIYKITDFNGDGKPDNITFMIKRIKVHTMNALKDPTYRFPGNYGVEKFLELFSEEDYDAFCLAYMFTYRDFEMGTLGLAWTGDLKNAGGVCEKNGHYRGSLKSLNTGIVTLLNYGKHVPPAVSHVTLAHEIGHNFGSPHDPEQCTPGGEDGNFIMFARATSGDKRNNNKFSPCSLKAIEPVLNSKARSIKGCFTEPQQAICGNGVVDPGEQCDCGWEEDCKDICCFPMSRHPRIDQKPCTLTPRASCSPSQGPCCTDKCSLKFGDKCRDDNGCRDPSFCDGSIPQCPPSINKPNKTICNKEFVCYMGECTGSICLAYGLESCQCIPTVNDPKTKACELCCKMPGETSICKSSFEWNTIPYDVPDMFAKPGTPCNDYNGYCDVFQKCREVDPSGPLATLRKLLLSEESIASFKTWMLSNWYKLALILLAIIILLVITTKLLAKGNTKSKSVTIIHSATTETVRLPDDNNGVIVHTAVRTKVPFKKKVRGERSTKKTKSTAIANNNKQLKNNLAATTSKVFKRNETKSNRNINSNNNSNNNNNNNDNNNINNSNNDNGKDSPKKLIRKKKRVSAPIVAEEQTTTTINNNTNGIVTPTVTNTNHHQLINNSKVIMKKPKKSKNKEIIDYSSNRTNSIHTNTFGKVHKWLLESPIVSSSSSSTNQQQPIISSSSAGAATTTGDPGPAYEHTSKIRKILSKSQSTPEHLITHKSPKKFKSVNNLNDKVKLQVVYKPPFRFSLKLSKNSAVKTKLFDGGATGGTGGVAGRLNKRKIKLDKERTNQLDGLKTKRTALLIRNSITVDDNTDIVRKKSPIEFCDTNQNPGNLNIVKNNISCNSTLNEPNYETLNSNKNHSQDMIEEGIYENVKNINSGGGSNTFRVSKSSSGPNLLANTKHSINNNNNNNNKLIKQRKGSLSNINQIGKNKVKHSNSASNLHKHNVDDNNLKQLTRSSTTNLTQNNLCRSSTTNLTKTRRHHSRDNSTGSFQIDDLHRNQRNSTYSKATGTNNNSNSSVQLRRGSLTNNIPRASLNIPNTKRTGETITAHQHPPLFRHISLQPTSTKSNAFHDIDNHSQHPSQHLHTHQHHQNVHHLQRNNNRPHTATGCNDSRNKFNWPNISSNEKLNKNYEPLPSDLEVMVSDIENLVNTDEV